MMAIKGIGEVKAIQLIAAIELGRRLAQNIMMRNLRYVLHKMQQLT